MGDIAIQVVPDRQMRVPSNPCLRLGWCIRRVKVELGDDETGYKFAEAPTMIIDYRDLELPRTLAEKLGKDVVRIPVLKKNPASGSEFFELTRPWFDEELSNNSNNNSNNNDANSDNIKQHQGTRAPQGQGRRQEAEVAAGRLNRLRLEREAARARFCVALNALGGAQWRVASRCWGLPVCLHSGANCTP